MLSSATNQLVASLQALLPGSSIAAEQGDDRVTIVLPAAVGADYHFMVEEFAGDAAAIGARPLGEAGRPVLWWMEWDPQAAATLTVEDVLPHIRRLANNPTRVVQRRRLLGASFTCEVFEGGAWSRFGEEVNLLGSKNAVAQSDAKVVTFSSPPLVGLASDAT